MPSDPSIAAAAAQGGWLVELLVGAILALCGVIAGVAKAYVTVVRQLYTVSATSDAHIQANAKTTEKLVAGQEQLRTGHTLLERSLADAIEALKEIKRDRQ